MHEWLTAELFPRWLFIFAVLLGIYTGYVIGYTVHANRRRR